VAAAVSNGVPGRLGLLVDEATNCAFLIDSGSVFSIIPHKSSSPPKGPRIVTADKTAIPCWGYRWRTLQVGGRQFKWKFLLADLSFPIVGADFLRYFKLAVDLANMRLIETASGSTFPLRSPPTGSTLAAVCLQLAVGLATCNESAPVTCGSTPAGSSSSSSPNSGGDININGGGEWSSGVLAGTTTCGSTSTATCGGRQAAGATCGGMPAGVATCGAISGGRQAAAKVNFNSVLKEFPAVVNSSEKLPPVKHKVVHQIITEGRPVRAKYRRLDAQKLEAAKLEFRELEAQGIVRRSKSNWASPLHMVKKSDGSWRPCGDFRQLNLQTKQDCYTCPNIGDLTARLAGRKFFSKIDLRKGYHQVPVDPADVEKTAIVTPFGLFEYTRMPFGLKNAGQTFQRMMDEVLVDMESSFCYMDDVMVASFTEEDHLEDLRDLFRRLEKHGLVLNESKCEIGRKSLEYLGHMISESGIRPVESKVEAIKKFPQPQSVSSLQTFLGMVNFYRRFLKGAAGILKPLTDVLKGGKKGKLEWSKEMEDAFSSIKKALSEAAELAHPVVEAELRLAVDASNTHVGAVLEQKSGAGFRPLGFFSRKLEPAQTRYSTFDRELLSCYLAIKHFRWSLEGRKFHIMTDHKPLVFALHRTSDHWTARQQRQMGFVAEFTADLRHVPGQQNVVADALSRPVALILPSQEETVSMQQIAQGQLTCSEVEELKKSSCLQVQEVILEGHSLWCDISTGVRRPLVPVECRRKVFEMVHCLSHPGIRATSRLLSSRFVWKGMASDTSQWCRDCPGCATGKVTVQERTPVERIPVPKKRFSHIHIDLVGPLPVSKEGCTHLLTVIDRATRWAEALPIKDTSATGCADAFVAGWIARFGVPHTITSDRGPQFTSSVWACLCKTLGIHHILTTAYHPQSNGMVERYHRQLKNALRARNCGAAWAEHLPWVLLGLRAAPKEDSNVSSAEAVYGAPLVLPNPVPVGPRQQDAPAEDPPALPVRPKTYAEAAAERPTILGEAEFVYVRKGPPGMPLAPEYAGPYEVLRRKEKAWEVQVGNRSEWISADRLKPHTGSKPLVAVPPRRGRPPGTGGPLRP